MAQFAVPTTDENLTPGWTVQGNSSPGYAQAAAIPVTTPVGQAGAGLPNPPGAENIGSENSASYSNSVLLNGSYSVTPNTSVTSTATLPVPTTTGVQQPFGIAASAAVVGAAVTSVSVAPFTTGTPAYTVQWTGTASANPITVSVPPAGFVKTVGANATAVTYTPNN